MSEPEALAMALGQSRVLAPSECVKCGAELSDREHERYISELRDWAQRHPGAWTDSLPGDLGNVASQHPYDRVLPDCESVCQRTTSEESENSGSGGILG